MYLYCNAFLSTTLQNPGSLSENAWEKRHATLPFDGTAFFSLDAIHFSGIAFAFALQKQHTYRYIWREDCRVDDKEKNHPIPKSLSTFISYCLGHFILLWCINLVHFVQSFISVTIVFTINLVWKSSANMLKLINQSSHNVWVSFVCF